MKRFLRRAAGVTAVALSLALLTGTALAGNGNGNSANAPGQEKKADATKQYGNGKTAAQIAVSRGAPAGTLIYGPGNSQPHKVVACGHTHAVDVHAIKSYSQTDCSAAVPVAPVKVEQTPLVPACGQSVVT